MWICPIFRLLLKLWTALVLQRLKSRRQHKSLIRIQCKRFRITDTCTQMKKLLGWENLRCSYFQRHQGIAHSG